VLAKKLSVNTFAMLFFRECILTTQYVPPLIYANVAPFPRNKRWLLAFR
jgi:hypothetical protein